MLHVWFMDGHVYLIGFVLCFESVLHISVAIFPVSFCLVVFFKAARSPVIVSLL